MVKYTICLTPPMAAERNGASHGYNAGNIVGNRAGKATVSIEMERL
jgi:hypothetical protein